MHSFFNNFCPLFSIVANHTAENMSCMITCPGECSVGLCLLSRIQCRNEFGMCLNRELTFSATEPNKSNERFWWLR